MTLYPRLCDAEAFKALSVLYRVKYSTCNIGRYRNVPKKADNLRTGTGMHFFIMQFRMQCFIYQYVLFCITLYYLSYVYTFMLYPQSPVGLLSKEYLLILLQGLLVLNKITYYLKKKPYLRYVNMWYSFIAF